MASFLTAFLVVVAGNASGQDNGSRVAIQNVATGKNLRPYNAGKQDGNRIILYSHHKWMCLTWDFQQVGDQTFKLKNRYTGKTFQVDSLPVAGSSLYQQPLRADSLQDWEFIKKAENVYNIRLKGTNLYITISSAKINSPIILQHKDSTTRQEWRLLPQNPLF